jgi:hypothetical protein
MAASCLLPRSVTPGWYLGVVVLDVVRGGVFLTSCLCFNILNVPNFVEECMFRFGVQSCQNNCHLPSIRKSLKLITLAAKPGCIAFALLHCPKTGH